MAWHGSALGWKVLAVTAALGLAVGNRLRHTPALTRGEAGAGARLANSIRLEIGLVALAFYGAAELVSVRPVDHCQGVALMADQMPPFMATLDSPV